MRVKFRDNLGSRDAEKHALDFRVCGRGMECDVPDATGRCLVSKGFATEVLQESPAIKLPLEIKAVPDSPSIGESDSPEIKADTKPARGAAKKSSTSQKDEL